MGIFDMTCAIDGSRPEVDDIWYSAFCALPTTACIVDNLGTIVAVNEKWYQNTLRSDGTIVDVGPGSNYFALHAQAAGDSNVHVCSVVQTLRAVLDGSTQTTVIDYPCSLPHRAGWYEVVISPISIEGRPGAVMMHNEPPHRRWRNIEALERMAATEAANRAETTFFATMSHELRTPLNAIVGFAELMSQEIFGPVGDERYRDYLSHVLSSARHLNDLVANLLDMSRIESGGYPISVEPLPLGDLLTDVLVASRAQTEGQDHEFVVAPVVEMPMVLADRRATIQVIGNLVANARYRAPEGSTIEFSWICDPIAEQCGLIIADRGLNHRADDAATTLWPSGQLNRGTEIEMNDIGLGLAIANRLAALLDGKIVFEARPEGGCSATLWLRLAESATP